MEMDWVTELFLQQSVCNVKVNCGDYTKCIFTLPFVGEDLYSLPNIVRVVKSRRMGWAGHVALMGEDRGVYRVLVGKPERKRPLGRPRRRWEGNIKMHLQEVGCGGVDWIELAQVGTGGGDL